MLNTSKRRPTALAVCVGICSFLVSLAFVGGILLLVTLYFRQLLPSLRTILVVVGAPVFFIGVMWSTVLLMEQFEKTTGISLRAKSARSRSIERTARD